MSGINSRTKRRKLEEISQHQNLTTNVLSKLQKSKSESISNICMTHREVVMAYTHKESSEKVLTEMKMLLLIMKRIGMSKNMTFSILFQLAPNVSSGTILRYYMQKYPNFIQNCTLDVLAMMTNLSKEFQAIETMCDMAASDGVTPEEGRHYFKLQYDMDPNNVELSDQDKENALRSMIDELAMLPTEVLRDDSIRKDFVNQDHIRIVQIIEKVYKDVPEISFHNYKLRRLPTSFLQFKNLEKINITFTELNFLPEWIDEFSELTDLCIGNNPHLMKLPESIENLNKIRFLDVYNNLGLVIPDRFKQLFNGILKLPEGIIQNCRKDDDKEN